MNKKNINHPFVLRACSNCDLLHQVPLLNKGSVARCIRCNSLIEKKSSSSINLSLALAITGLILFILSNWFPILILKAQGLQQEGSLYGASISLFDDGQILLAILVGMTTLCLPLLSLLGIIYVLMMVKMQRDSTLKSAIFRLIMQSELWAMLEIFLLAIIVTGVKLGDVAEVIQGLSLYSFIIMILVLLYLQLSLNPSDIWDQKSLDE